MIVMKKKLIVVPLAIFIALAGCDGSSISSVEENHSSSISTIQNDELSEEHNLLVNKVLQRAEADGIQYNYDEMKPIVEEANGDLLVYFVFQNSNVVGGSPEARISKDSGEIIDIEYSR